MFFTNRISFASLLEKIKTNTNKQKTGQNSSGKARTVGLKLQCPPENLALLS